MAKKKRKPDNTPRRKRFKRAQRLEAAKSWLPTYEGKDIVKGYRKRYGVDFRCAFVELEMLGIEIDPARKEQTLRDVERQAEIRRQKKLERAAELESQFGWPQDDHFAMIIGYTSGGAPYGVTWEEWEDIQAEDNFEP
jgi:hypothetical protein